MNGTYWGYCTLHGDYTPPDCPKCKKGMTGAEAKEYRKLVNLWHCTEPMTKEQVERMDYLHALTVMTQGTGDNSGAMDATPVTQK